MNFFLLMFIVMPIVEMVLLIKVGSLIGAFYTVLMVLLTALIGVSLLKKQGLSTLLRANHKMQAGQMPVSEIGEGVLLAVAGALLLTPGFVTDSMGFILLTPGLRKKIAILLAQKMIVQGKASMYTQYQYKSSRSADDFKQTPFGGDEIIEGEFEELDERQIKGKLKKDS